MDGWLNVEALVKVLVFGIIAGAGLPALFAVGVRTHAVGTGTIDGQHLSGDRRPVLTGVAYVCFALVATAVALVHTGGEGVMNKPTFLESVLGWLREGYPQGVPARDYVPLLALLRRRLTEDEIAAIVKELDVEGASPIDSVDIGASITKVTDALPSEDDINRVREHLPAGL
jgi:hypothetical protein